jgi:hypothetical protein
MRFHERFDRSNPQESKRMAALPTDKQMLTARQGLRHAAGDLVDHLTREHMKRTGTTDYGRAMQSVLQADPALRDKYLHGVTAEER